MGCKGIKWIQLAQNMVQSCALLKTLINLLVP
jgi:hypothetical protein